MKIDFLECESTLEDVKHLLGVATMAKIEFGFSQKDAYDFVIKNERKETTRDDKKVVEKRKVVKYKNPAIDCWGCVHRMTAENAPEVLKNVEYFRAANPFGQYGIKGKYEPFGWTLPMALLAFKKGYIDGFLSSRSFFSLGLETEGIIIVDPIQRIKVKEWTQTEYKDFFDKCKEEDFEYSVTKSSSARLGKSLKYETAEKLKQHLIEEHEKEGKDFFKTEQEQKMVEEHGFDKVLDALANLLYYDTDLVSIWGYRTAEPLTFDSHEAAEAFRTQYKTWENIYRDDEKAACDIIPVNEKFDAYLESLKENSRKELERATHKAD